MKLYYSKGACSLVVRIIINEIGLKSEYESVDLKTKKTESGKNFLEINSKGAVPTLETKNGEILTENAVILQYLADDTHTERLLSKVGDFRRYRILEWLNYVATEFHKSIALLFNPTADDNIKEKFIIPMIKLKLKYVNQKLEGKNYFLDDFTLPDAYFYVMLTWLHHFKFDLSEWPNIHNYFIHNGQRPSIVKSLQEEKLVTA